MKKLILSAVVMMFIAACSNNMTAPHAMVKKWKPPSTKAPATIELKKKGGSGPVCIDASKTKVNNCRKHKKNQSCNVPGDTITWEWKNKTIDRPFTIAAKTGFNASTFFESNADCTTASNKVICTIKTTVPKNSFFEYNVIVDAEDPDFSCNLDPRFLIY
ncbi:MAG: hypothetical protein ABJ308_00310 [Halieaceae bacterium]